MKHLKNFNNYKPTQNVNEGFKEKAVLAGLAALLSLKGQSQESKPRLVKTKTQSETTLKSLLKQGWSLDSTSTKRVFDGVVKEKPDTQVIVTRLSLDKSQFFKSGNYELTPEMKSDLDSTITEIIESGGIIIRVDVESSTDKQGLSKNLQDKLEESGFSPDNKGLSKARSNSVQLELEDLGLDLTLIKIITLSEQGDEEVSQSARYVNVDFYYLQSSTVVMPKTGEPKEDKKIYHLSKIVKTGIKKMKKGNQSNTKKLGPIKNFLSPSAVECSFDN
jgi:flagellar motor protein MotB